MMDYELPNCRFGGLLERQQRAVSPLVNLSSRHNLYVLSRHKVDYAQFWKIALAA